LNIERCGRGADQIKTLGASQTGHDIDQFKNSFGNRHAGIAGDSTGEARRI
jgi:hypothetical protein